MEDYLQNMQSDSFTLHAYLKGKVADYTISDNVIYSVCFDRDLDYTEEADAFEKKDRMLCYADLLKYIYLQPSLTKSYSQTNDSWSAKEGSTQLTANDKKRIFDEMSDIYKQYGEEFNIPKSRSTIQFSSVGMRITKCR